MLTGGLRVDLVCLLNRCTLDFRSTYSLKYWKLINSRQIGCSKQYPTSKCPLLGFPTVETIKRPEGSDCGEAIKINIFIGI
jgi:hypothetical protein